MQFSQSGFAMTHETISKEEEKGAEPSLCDSFELSLSLGIGELCSSTESSTSESPPASCYDNVAKSTNNLEEQHDQPTAMGGYINLDLTLSSTYDQM